MSAVFDSRLLNWVIFSPLAFAVLLAFLPRTEKGQIRVLTLAGMLVNLGLAALTWSRFVPGGAEFQLEYRAAWVPEIGLSYHVGLDGLAAALVLLTGILGPLVVLASWSSVENRTKEFHLALLGLQAAMMGALCALDILLFYIFFEAMLIPMYLLIGVWGAEDRQMAATKFFIYTLVGSLLMLVALLGVYFLAQPSGQRSFDYAAIYNGLSGASRELLSPSGPNAELSALATALARWGPWMFLAFAIAFAIKVPMFPLHTWLPDAHVQAPVAGSMILAGVLLKMGTFGFWRFAIPLFPAAAAEYRVALATLSVVGIVYGALVCLAQKDIKKLIAYSSVSHLGYCMLGLLAYTAEGASGSAYQMLNHGVSTGALFLLFGFLYERSHTRGLNDYGGIARVMPGFAVAFLIVTFSSIAVPGTNGFVGEFLILLGTFKSDLPRWMAVAAATGVVLGAAYMLWMVQRVFFGPIRNPDMQHLKDLRPREWLAVAPFLLLILAMGLRPQPILDVLAPSAERYLARARPAAGADPARLRVEAKALAAVGAPAPKPSLPLVPARPLNFRAPSVLPQPAPQGVP